MLNKLVTDSTENTMQLPLEFATNRIPKIILEDYKGFTIRECRKGYLAFKAGRQLETCKTIEGAKRSVDSHLEWEVRHAELQRQEKELAEARKREEAERERLRTEAILACIQPIRDFVAIHGMEMLQDCVEQLEQEELDRNVPPNWESLVEKCEAIGQWFCEHAVCDEDPSDVEVSEYGVIEYYGYNSNFDTYAFTRKYKLEDYVDEYGHLVDDEDESED
jgi:hypothetical protein